MPAYMISYDLRRDRNYDALTQQLRTWNCVRPLRSLWFGNLTGSAETIRDLLRTLIDGDDGLLVIEIKPTSDWAGIRLEDSDRVEAWMRANVGP